MSRPPLGQRSANIIDLALIFKVVISQPKPSEFQHLKDLGVREEHLMADPDGSLAARIGLNEKRFPYILVISMAPDGDVVMALQISGIQGDQQAQGAVLASLRFLFGERP